MVTRSGYSNIPALYRSHEGPTESKLANLREFIGELGLTLGGGESPTPLDYQRLSLQIRSREDANLIQTMMLRSMSQAIYEPDNKGHFGHGVGIDFLARQVFLPFGTLHMFRGHLTADHQLDCTVGKQVGVAASGGRGSAPTRTSESPGVTWSTRKQG